eukprot:NODE_3657_length_645_cov_70.862416_g2620_i0.p2 GENE.NODE_3657_length_645_cov_70.862416_g2620_i0~~NODE_3657_length_645_cov_70.862416_g2620_i0.p2  ORF type:complete len:52 (+),score=6.95 NODE_3657_length_645_cov_70.862416_g2620_i0:176-331(+)
MCLPVRVFVFFFFFFLFVCVFLSAQLRNPVKVDQCGILSHPFHCFVGPLSA